eukprot:COSAG05_NODE_2714_length_2737_cov_140.062412_5_plen_61_part_00
MQSINVSREKREREHSKKEEKGGKGKGRHLAGAHERFHLDLRAVEDDLGGQTLLQIVSTP